MTFGPGNAAEAFVIAKLLKAGFDAHGARRDAPYDIGLTSERDGIAASRSKAAIERIKGNGTFVLSGETPGPGAVPTQPQTSTSPRASRCPLSGSRSFRACTPRSG